MTASLDHIFLFGLLFFTFIYYGYNSTALINKTYWGRLLFPILLYSLVIGLRYGWGNDYMEYLYQYQTDYVDVSHDYGFVYLSKLIKSISFGHFWCMTIIYALTFIVGAALMVKNEKGHSWMIMLFLPSTLMLSTYAMRQYFALSFVFIGMYLLLNNDSKSKKIWLYSVLLLALSYTIHASSLIVIIVLLLSIVLTKLFSTINYKTAIVIYILSIVFSNTLFPLISGYFTNLTALLSLNDSYYVHYSENYDQWFGTGAINDGSFAHSGVYVYFEYIGQAMLIMIGGLFAKQSRSTLVMTFFNVFCIAMCFQQVFFSMEILRRMIDPFVALYFVPVGYGIYAVKNKLYKEVSYNSQVFALVISLLYIFYPMYRFITGYTMCGFVWD